jgi:hypothetical protein
MKFLSSLILTLAFVLSAGTVSKAAVILPEFGPIPVVVHTGWIVPPTVQSQPFDPGNGGLALTSSYNNGVYVDSAGNQQTANVSVTSIVVPEGNKWRYNWTISNAGSGTFVEWFGPKPPNFLQGPLIAGATQTDTLLNGPPVVKAWGGRWNPEVGEEAPYLSPAPVPLPASVFLLGAALGLMSAIRRRA